MSDIIKLLKDMTNNDMFFVIRDNSGKIITRTNTKIEVDIDTLKPINENTLYDDKNKQWYKISTSQHNGYHIITYTNETALHLQIEEAQRQIDFDLQTGVYSRKRILELGTTNLNASIINKIPIFVVMCDLDNFREINNQYGHLPGDIILASIGVILTARMRDNPGCFIGRVGGDEFFLFYLNYTKEQVISSLDDIRKAILSIESIGTNIITGQQERIAVSASFGFCQNPFTVNTPGQLEMIRKMADKLLYKSKNIGGKNCISFLNTQTGEEQFNLQSREKLY